MHRNGGLLLTLVLPDGSRSLIPASWTDLDMNLAEAGPTLPPGNRPSTSATLGSLSHLLHTRKVVDSLLRKTDSSEQVPLIPSKEERERATPTRPLVRSGKTAPETDRREELDPNTQRMIIAMLARLISKAVYPKTQEDNHER